MATFNLQGRWLDRHYEMNIVMTGGGEFNMKAITAELQQYWVAGHGEVFESGKIRGTFCHPENPDATVWGIVTADGRTINWDNKVVWRRR